MSNDFSHLPAHPAYDCSQAAGDAAGYVLGALEPDEASTFARHLASCAVCRDEVEAFAQVTDLLAISVPQHDVPRRVRRAVIAGTRTTEPRRAPRLRHAVPRVAAGFAALALVAVGIAAGAGMFGSSSPAPEHIVQADVYGSHAEAELRLGSGHAELVVRDMPPPADGEIYEVWLKRTPDSRPRATTALFSPTSRGAGIVEVPGNLHAVSEVLVTQEPAGGSLDPTSAPVIVAHLTSA